MSRNTKAIGEKAEGQVLAALLRADKTVLLPFGDNQRYDLVVEEEGTFLRIQCKNGRLREGSILFNACSTLAKSGERRGYAGQAEFFGVYCPDVDKVYLVPVQQVQELGDVSLRLYPPKNKQVQGVRLASDYELGANIALLARSSDG